MISPMRVLSAWIDYQRLRERCLEVEWQLSIVLKQEVWLVPNFSSGGTDRIFLAQTRRYPARTLACVRMSCPWRDNRTPEPHLARVQLTAPRRIARESRVYDRLAPLQITPALIARGEHFLANQFLPWPRASEVLRKDPETLWRILPKALEAIRKMHAHGVVHLDLNCGNLLVSPDFSNVAIIDFEFAPLKDMTAFDQQRFDFLRFAHNLLKRRRGRDAAFREPHRFVDLFAQFAPESGFGLPDLLNPIGFSRVLENHAIANGLKELLGAFEFSEFDITLK